MKKYLLLILITVFFVSCTSKKKYTYVQINKEKAIIGNSYDEKKAEPVVIEAENDSIAWMEANQKFYISQAVSQKTNSGFTIPVYFELYNDKNELILFTDSEELYKLKERIFKMVLNKEATTSDVKNDINNVDSIKVKELIPFFNFKEDEFDPDGKTWIKPKSSPKYIDVNHTYCYFMKRNNVVSNFRLKIQYYAEDWLFINKYQFSIDGKAYELIPENPERDHGSGNIWEWSDERINTISEVELIRALAGAKSAKIKYIGSQYHNIRTIPEKQLLNIKRTLELYEAMGGEF